MQTKKESLSFSRYAAIPALHKKFLVKLYIPIKKGSFAPDPRYVQALDQVISNIDRYFDEFFKEDSHYGMRTLDGWYHHWLGGTSQKYSDKFKALKDSAVITSIGMGAPLNTGDVSFWIDFDLPSPKLDGDKDAVSGGHCLYIENGKVNMEWQGYSN
jgi:hypothetical protein